MLGLCDPQSQAFSYCVCLRLHSASPWVLFIQSLKVSLWPPTMNITVKAVSRITVAAIIISRVFFLIFILVLLNSIRLTAVSERYVLCYSFVLFKDSKKNISESVLWNVNHVEEDYSPDFLDLLEEKVEQTTNEP